jgi:CRISPR system Cascade subunit CasE
MYLSRLILNPRSRQVRRELSNPYELHRTILQAFPDQDQGGPGRVLFRLESPADRPAQAGLALLVQSDKEPDWGWLAATAGYLWAGPEQNPACKSFDLSFQPGQRLYFRLRANPTVKRKFPGESASKRVGLYKEEEQQAWLARKAEQGGFQILSSQATAEGKVGGQIHRSTGESHNLNLLAVRFEGLLQVTDPERFRQSLQGGIGSGKGLGFGLLSLARA